MKKVLLALAAAVVSVSSAFAATVGDTYTKVASSADLTVGDEYILCYDTNAMGALSGKFYSRIANGVTLNGNVATIGNASVMSFTVVEGTAAGTFAFQLSGGSYMSCTGTANNSMSSSTTLVANCNMSVTISNGTATIIPTNNSNSNNNKFQYNSNSGQERFSNYKTGSQKNCTLYKKDSGGNIVLAPSISCTDNVVTITNNEEGASVYYTIDGNTPDATSTLYTAPFPITETCTVKAIAIKDGESSVPTTYNATFVKTFTSLKEVVALANGTEFKFAGNVTAFYANGLYLYVQDSQANGALLYGTETGYVNGDVFDGMTGTISVYAASQLTQIQPYTLGEKSATSSPVEPKEVEFSALADCDVFSYVKVDGVSVTNISNRNFNLSKDGSTFTGYNQFNTTVELPADDLAYDVVGIVSEHKGNKQFLPISFTKSIVAPAEVEPFVSSIAAVNDVITAARGIEITFTSLHAAKIAVEIEVEGQEATSTEVESDKFVYTVSEAAIISLTSYNVDGTEAHSAVYEIALEAAPLCGEVVFNPASGSAVIAGSEVTITCENAATITYIIEINGELGDAIEVEGNEAKVVINEACTIHADAKNIDGVLSEAAEASYTIAEAPATGSAMFDFTKVDEIKAMTSENITPSSGSVVAGNTYLSGITLTEASGISVSFVKNSSDTNYPRWFGSATAPTGVRIYSGNTMTVSVPEGCVISSIVFTTYGDNYFGFSASTGAIDKDSKTWTPTPAASAMMREAAAGVESVKFTATTQNRIATMKVNYERTTVGVGNVVVDDANAPVEYYNLQGVRVENPANGLYIRRQGNNVSKVFVR